MQAVEGVSAILYIQTCAAEKRRRRKRGQFPDPDMRVFINPDVCEGCGDCGVQSNCVSILPLETAVRPQADDRPVELQQGLSPASRASARASSRSRAPRSARPSAPSWRSPTLPEPALPAIDGTYNIVVTGVGGTGVVTIGALIAMAAHLEGLGAGEMEMAGLAQKGGAVHIHCRIAAKPSDISAIRVAVGEADAVIGGDLVVTAGAKTLGLMTRGRTRAVVNAHEIPTGDFTRDRGFRLPTDRMTLALRARIGDDGLRMLDASRLAERLLGDAIYANVLMLGAAWQAGLVPLSEEALRRAIEINGASVAGNLEAFAHRPLGRSSSRRRRWRRPAAPPPRRRPRTTSTSWSSGGPSIW